MLKLSNDIKIWIQYELKVREVVVWAGQPLSREDMKPISDLLFFLVCSFFFICFVFSVFELSIKYYFFALLIMMPFFIIAFDSSSFHSVPKSLSTVYMITNLRAISFDASSARKFISYYPRQLKNIEKRQNMDGSGSIIFETEIYINRGGIKSSRMHGFIAIKDVNRVGDLLEKLAHSKA